MSKKSDKELLEEIEALGETIEWLENKGHSDLEQVPESFSVDEKELESWLRSPSLAQARSWLKK